MKVETIFKVIQLTKDKNQEIKRLNTKLGDINSYYKHKVDQQSTEINNLKTFKKQHDKAVNFEKNSNYITSRDRL